MTEASASVSLLLPTGHAMHDLSLNKTDQVTLKVNFWRVSLESIICAPIQLPG